MYKRTQPTRTQKRASHILQHGVRKAAGSMEGRHPVRVCVKEVQSFNSQKDPHTSGPLHWLFPGFFPWLFTWLSPCHPSELQHHLLLETFSTILSKVSTHPNILCILTRSFIFLIASSPTDILLLLYVFAFYCLSHPSECRLTNAGTTWVYPMYTHLMQCLAHIRYSITIC